MAKKRTPMNKIKEVLHFKYKCGLSYRRNACSPYKTERQSQGRECCAPSGTLS